MLDHKTTPSGAGKKGPRPAKEISASEGWAAHRGRERKKAALAGFAATALALGVWALWEKPEPAQAPRPALAAPQHAEDLALSDRVAPKPRGAGEAPASMRLAAPSQQTARGVEFAPAPAPKIAPIFIAPVQAPTPDMQRPDSASRNGLAVDERGIATLPDGSRAQTKPVGAPDPAAVQAARERKLKALEAQALGNLLPVSVQNGEQVAPAAR
jgi:hypothetical protein